MELTNRKVLAATSEVVAAAIDAEMMTHLVGTQQIEEASMTLADMATVPRATGEKITGAELAVRTLLRLNVDHAFNINGAGMFPLVEALHNHRDSIRYISAVNETNLSLIAHGYASGSGKPAFANVYHASGTSLAMMGLTTAWADHVPLVLTSTTSSRAYSTRDQYAAVAGSITEIAKSYTKWSYEVPLPERIPEVLSRAFALAATPPLGPVHIAFPMDVLAAETIDCEYGAAQCVMYTQQAADERGVAAIAEILSTARKPVIVVGQEVRQYGAIHELVSLAEAVGCPVITDSDSSVAHYGFPTTHSQYVGKLTANADLLADTDFALLIGPELTESGPKSPTSLINPETQVAILSVDPYEVQKQLRPSIGIIGHPKPTLTALAKAVHLESDNRDWRNRVASVRARREEAAANLRKDRWEQSPIAIGRLITELTNAMPTGTVVVNQAGGHYPLIETLLDIDPDEYYGISGKASAQGWAGPASIGIQLARPDKRVVALMGDGGFMFSATAIRTASHFNIPVVFVVLNNGGWRTMAASIDDAGQTWGKYERDYGWEWLKPPIRHALVAEGLGLRSETVDQPTGLADAFRRAFASAEPTLLEILADPYEAELFVKRIF